MNYRHIIAELMSCPWAILPDKFAQIMEFVSIASSGASVDAALVARITAAADARYGAAVRKTEAAQPGIAVINIFGTIAQRLDMLGEISGGTSTDRISRQLRGAAADTSVGAIVLNIDSPGGSVYGIQELGAEIAALRGQKKVVAMSNSLAASAAYWLATQADEIVVTPGGEVGSVGVLTGHQDISKMMEAQGVNTTLISAGKYKVEGNPFAPLDDEARAAIQTRIDEYYEAFVKAVATGRGVSASDVRNGFGEGRVVGAKQAVELGMADRVATFDEVVAKLQTGPRGRTMKRKAQAQLQLAQV